MKTASIRPEKLRVENRALHQEDVKKILAHADAFVTVPCPACTAEGYEYAFAKDGFDFSRCRQCETLFINPRPTPEMLADFYTHARSIQHWNDCIFPASEDARRLQIFAPRAQRVAELCRKHATAMDLLVDVGAGFGTFCEEMQKLKTFERIIAVEPSVGLAQTCRRKGIEVIEQTIEESSLPKGEVNVITNFELIEHLFDPADFVRACHGALAQDGLIILTTPNVRGFDLLTLGPLSGNIDGPNHLNYFHPAAIETLLERCGFAIVEILTPGKLDAELVRTSILKGDLAIDNQPFLKQVLIDEWESLGERFQEFLADNTLSSHMWVVARKI